MVLCEKQYRGRVEQFVESLRTGFPDREWEDATRGDKYARENPFRGGLLGKFRLSRVTYEYEEISGTSPDEYQRAVRRVLQRLPNTPHLAIVQTRKTFITLAGNENPYFVAKAAFMAGGVPVQSIAIETIESVPVTLAYVLNNVAVASYAKLNGIPWVLSTRAPSSHELVIGMGYAEVSASRLAERMRFVGITTLFQGDGRYIVWGVTREVEFANYADALLESLRTTIDHIRTVNSWRDGDHVRLMFHVYKPLKHREIDAVRALVKDLLADAYQVQYAFVDLSHFHEYQLFDPASEGKSYRADDRWKKKGIGVPERGICLQLGPRSALLTLTGPPEMKTEEQGMPRPLLIEVHESSDFADLAYLARQIYHFTYMSWRSFFPGTEPVTISYSRLIARALGNLKPVAGWNSTVLTVGQLRNRQMVSLTPDGVFDARRDALCRIVVQSLPTAPFHTAAFAFRIFRASDVELLRAHAEIAQLSLDSFADVTSSALGNTAAYGGVPEIAALGFELARDKSAPDQTAVAFLNGIDRLRGRPANALDALATDDVALLGIADGLAALRDDGRAEDATAWLLPIVSSRPASNEFSARLRTLTLELLEPRGRLRASVAANDPDVIALEIVCQTVWPERFEGCAAVSVGARRNLFLSLVREQDAHVGDLEKAALHLSALDRLLEDAVVRVLPTLDDLVRVLHDTQTSLKRWV